MRKFYLLIITIFFSMTLKGGSGFITMIHPNGLTGFIMDKYTGEEIPFIDPGLKQKSLKSGSPVCFFKILNPNGNLVAVDLANDINQYDSFNNIEGIEDNKLNDIGPYLEYFIFTLKNNERFETEWGELLFKDNTFYYITPQIDYFIEYDQNLEFYSTFKYTNKLDQKTTVN